MSDTLVVKELYDPVTGTFTYLVIDKPTSECIIVDPVLDYDVVSGGTSLDSLQPVMDEIDNRGYTLRMVLETHAHADHLTAAKQLKERYQCGIAIGVGIRQIQQNFKKIYGFDDHFSTDGSAFDHLLEDGDTLSFGGQTVHVIATPGHTADSLSFRINNYLFIGDTLFHPDIGSARCDFPGGDAKQLFQSINTLLSYDDDTILCLCHDYPDQSRAPETFISVARMKDNIHLVQAANDSEKFVDIRRQRDENLALPKLIIPSVQVNCQAGLDLNDENARLYWPVDKFK